ncbi:MAG: hypothetical protein KF832_09850 [Caldilineaceae bacterium]|nr:hypothetical protein [Caldilineaceae bacterium]
MTIIVENVPIPERGRLEIDLKQSIEIKVTAEEARRKVNRWLLDHVSYMMHADPPTLIVDGKRAVWRVPAIYTASPIGIVGTVGLIDVDVYSGTMDSKDERKEQIIRCAQEKAAILPPYIPGQMKVPEEFIAKHLPRAKLAQLPEDDDE